MEEKKFAFPKVISNLITQHLEINDVVHMIKFNNIPSNLEELNINSIEYLSNLLFEEKQVDKKRFRQETKDEKSSDTFIRLYTQKGGVTYGSEEYESVNLCLERSSIIKDKKLFLYSLKFDGDFL